MRFPVFCCRYRLTVVTSKIRLRPDIRCRVSGIRLKINIRPSLLFHDKWPVGCSDVTRSAKNVWDSPDCSVSVLSLLPFLWKNKMQSETADFGSLPSRTKHTRCILVDSGTFHPLYGNMMTSTKPEVAYISIKYCNAIRGGPSHGRR